MQGKALHPIEKRFLRALLSFKKVRLEEVSEAADLEIDQARRALEWLRSKGLIEVEELRKRYYSLGRKGKEAVIAGLPERRLAVLVKEQGRIRVEEAQKILGMDKNEFNAALGRAIRRRWISLHKDDGSFLIPLSEPEETEEERLLKKLMRGPLEESYLSKEELQLLSELKKRPEMVDQEEKADVFVRLLDKWKSFVHSLSVEEEVVLLRPEHLLEDKWKRLKFSEIDIAAPTPPVYPARKHPLNEFIKLVKEIFVSMGFEEVDGPLIQPAFWNFDALFTPQDHPAREMQDTFYIHGAEAKLPDASVVKKVKEVHENGGDTGSKGWGYKWLEEKARKVVLRTHTTAVTIRALYRLENKDAKVFSVGRVFRNENVDSKHLAEFHQVEGIVVGEGMTLRHLMGYLTLFYKKLGFKKVKFWPTFFPYTEPSLQSMVYSEKLGKWLELCGMGIFRPEVVEPLGVKKPVLAWGMGLERLAILYYDVTDIRQFYINRLSWLRSIKCR